MLKLDFKTILITFKEDKKLIEKRIQDRLNLYPHYKRILKKPEFYLAQQALYKNEIKKSKTPYLIVETENLPDQKIINDIILWLEKK